MVAFDASEPQVAPIRVTVPRTVPDESLPFTLKVPDSENSLAFAVPVNEPLLLTFIKGTFTKYSKTWSGLPTQWHIPLSPSAVVNPVTRLPWSATSNVTLHSVGE